MKNIQLIQFDKYDNNSRYEHDSGNFDSEPANTY